MQSHRCSLCKYAGLSWTSLGFLNATEFCIKINWFIKPDDLVEFILRWEMQTSRMSSSLPVIHTCILGSVFAPQWFPPSFPSVTFTANWRNRKEGFSPLMPGLLGNPSPAWNEMDRGRETSRGTSTCTLEERGTRTVAVDRDLLLMNARLKLIRFHKQGQKLHVFCEVLVIFYFY